MIKYRESMKLNPRPKSAIVRSNPLSKKSYILGSIALLVIISIITLTAIRATKQFTSLQPESGRLTSNVTIHSGDPSASGGSFVKFGQGNSFSLAKTVTSDTGNVAVFWSQAMMPNLDHYEIWRDSTKVGNIDASQVTNYLVGNRIGVDGANSTKSDAIQQADGIQDAGFGWARINLHWWVTQNTSSTAYDWSVFDASVDLAASRGLKVIGLIAYTPPWARSPAWQNTTTCNQNRECTQGHVPPANMQDYANFARAAAQRYGAGSSRRYKVTTWEIWNEPNIAGFWSDTPANPNPNIANYTNMLKLAYASIKSADPSATVISGGLSPSGDRPDGSGYRPTTFLSGIYQNGGKGFMDGIGMHPYADDLPPTDPSYRNNYHNVYALHDVAVANGEASKQIWGTEAEYSVGDCTGCVDESTQAAYEQEMVYNWWGFSYSGPFVFWRWQDVGIDPSRIFQLTGFVRQDLTPKLSAAMIDRVNHQLVYVDSSVPNSGTFAYQIKAVDSSGLVINTNSLTATKP